MLFAALLAVAVAALAGTLVLVLGRSGGEPGPPRAAIVDHLSLTFPNPDFVETATTMLEEGGYVVDYYPGEEVTVEFYRDLPRKGYELVILRVHSALLEADPAPPADVPAATWEQAVSALADDVFLFTSQPYSLTTHFEEQKALRLIPVRYYDYAGSPDYSRYFGIASDFVRSSMRGDLDGAAVVLMGCDGLTFDDTAIAFTEIGAGAVFGWDGSVSAEHTDAATERLLEHLAVEGLSMGKAVELTMQEVGPDPAYGSELRLYPPKEAAFTLP